MVEDSQLANRGVAERDKGEPDPGQVTPPNFFTEITPSGIEVRFQTHPKRKYELRRFKDWEVRLNIFPEWEEVPSVTTVLDVLHKPLHYWGMKIGIAGCIELVKEFGTLDDVDSTVELLKERKLTVNQVRDKAGDRGLAVHKAFEMWSATGIIPEPKAYSKEEAGYVEGLAKFLRHLDPEPILSEVMVGSLEHGYAGRYDAQIRVPTKCEVVYHVTEKKRTPRWAQLAPGQLLVDLKTSSGIYLSHHLQLEAYETASVECGYPPSDGRGIIHVMPDGEYEFKRSVGRSEDFLSVLGAYRALEQMNERKKAQYK